MLFRSDQRQQESSPRLKTVELKAVSGTPAATVSTKDSDQDSFGAALKLVREELETKRGQGSNRIAIRCRTNHEVAHAYRDLRDCLPELSVQQSSTARLGRLRHLGLWSDLLKVELAERGDRPLSEDLFDKVDAVYRESGIPEVTSPRAEDFHPRVLWDLCARESSYPYLSHLIDFIGGLDSADAIRLIGRDVHQSRQAVVSTIHKVKGLEFDEVIVMPSSANFSVGVRSTDARPRRYLCRRRICVAASQRGHEGSVQTRN